MKVILHTGFHKTGTTSLQETLRANRKRMAPDVRLILRPGMKALCQTARAWSASDDPIDLGMVKYEAAILAETLQDETARTVILSSEDLCGHMPGRKGVKTYAAAPKLMQSIALGFRAALPDAAIEFLFTTRESDDWLENCHAQHLAASRMRLNLKDFRRKFARAADLDQVVDAVKGAVKGHKVHSAALEALTDLPLGPAQAAFDVLDLPADTVATLQPGPRVNPAPDPEIRAALLALNQSEHDDGHVRAAKRALLKNAR